MLRLSQCNSTLVKNSKTYWVDKVFLLLQIKIISIMLNLPNIFTIKNAQDIFSEPIVTSSNCLLPQPVVKKKQRSWNHNSIINSYFSFDGLISELINPRSSNSVCDIKRKTPHFHKVCLKCFVMQNTSLVRRKLFYFSGWAQAGHFEGASRILGQHTSPAKHWAKCSMWIRAVVPSGRRRSWVPCAGPMGSAGRDR